MYIMIIIVITVAVIVVVVIIIMVIIIIIIIISRNTLSYRTPPVVASISLIQQAVLLGKLLNRKITFPLKQLVESQPLTVSIFNALLETL